MFAEFILSSFTERKYSSNCQSEYRSHFSGGELVLGLLKGKEMIRGRWMYCASSEMYMTLHFHEINTITTFKLTMQFKLVCTGILLYMKPHTRTPNKC
jgi:hypothetical protein